jgi:hypothetical protein
LAGTDRFRADLVAYLKSRFEKVIPNRPQVPVPGGKKLRVFSCYRRPGYAKRSDHMWKQAGFVDYKPKAVCLFSWLEGMSAAPFVRGLELIGSMVPGLRRCVDDQTELFKYVAHPMAGSYALLAGDGSGRKVHLEKNGWTYVSYRMLHKLAVREGRKDDAEIFKKVIDAIESANPSWIDNPWWQL